MLRGSGTALGGIEKMDFVFRENDVKAIRGQFIDRP